VVNTQVPAISYANWFSYEIDFISQNKEIEQAFTTTCRLYPGYKVRFVGDAGLSRCAKVFRTFPNGLNIRNNLVNLVGHYTIPGGPIVPDYSQ
jgi:hypothetical protein